MGYRLFGLSAAVNKVEVSPKENTMKISEAFPSNFLKAQDLNGHVCKAVIADIKVQDVGGQGRAEDHKPILLLQGKTKGIVLNKTNATIIQLRQ